MAKAVTYVIVIIRINSTITPKPQKKGQAKFGGATLAVVLSRLAGWECHPCCRPELGSGSCFLKLDSELTKQDIMLERKFMN